MYRSTSLVLMAVLLVIMAVALAVSFKQHSDEIANLKEMVKGDAEVGTVSNVINSPLPGGWYSNWDVIDQTIRRPRHPGVGYVTDPNQNYYAPGSNGGGIKLTPAARFEQNSRGNGNPMITSVKTPMPLGSWAQIGTAYTTNPSDSTVVYLYQKTLDPDRDFYQYKVVNEHGFEIPLDSGITELKNGMTFSVPGWDSKGPFTANITNDGYSFVYV